MRVCQRLGCENSLDHLRADAQYCGPTCKREAERARSFSSDGTAAPGFWPRYVLVRRQRRRTAALPAILAVLAALMLLTGCGSARTTTVTSTSTVAAKPSPIATIAPVTTSAPAPTCDLKNDATMQCVLAKLPPPTKLFGLSPAHLYGVDYGWNALSVNALKSIHAVFAASYFSHDPSKNWTRASVNAMHAAHIGTVGVWETGATRAEEGPVAGAEDAMGARSDAASVGDTAGAVDFAIDCDCSGPVLSDYFIAVHKVLGSRDDAYGGYDQIHYLYYSVHPRPIGNLNWQTYAWSDGRWLPASVAPLEQYLNGSAFDNDRALAANYGQWPAPPSGPSAAQLKKWRNSRDASFRAWHASSCEQHLAARACFDVYGQRVIYFQDQLGREHCFGTHAQVNRYLCRVVRPEVSRWSHMRVAAQRSLTSHGCRKPYRRDVCVVQGQRVTYANRQIKQRLY